MTTLQELIEETDTRQVMVRIKIGGATLPAWTSVEYDFKMGQVPVATVTVPSRAYLPIAVAEEASVEIWFGFMVGLAFQERLVFGGAVVDSVSFDSANVVIECVMDGPRKLAYGYNRRINYNFSAVTAEDSVTALLDLAGVASYYVELDPWVIGTAVPQTIQFSTYGEAINKVAEVDGSPWYAIPTGMVRVEKRDPIPSTTARRIYFSNVLTGPFSTQPFGIVNTDAKPRVDDIQARKYRSEVANFIEVDGAILVTLGPNGEQNSNQIFETVDGASGQFPSGAYWIPTPPLFQDFTFSNELIDTNAKAFEVAERYFDLKNRLFQKIPLSIPGDPDVFLGETIQLVDPNYTGIADKYFVEAYHTVIDSNSCVTTLQLTGGPESGTRGFAAPFAEFIWKYQALHDITPSRWINSSNLNLGPNADQAAKICEDVPENTGTPDQGADFAPGEDRRTVIVTLDGTPSQDFDGQIVSYQWDYIDYLTIPRTLFGSRITLVFDPDIVSTVEVTLLVTDDSGRTSDITKTIFTSADWSPIPVDGAPNLNDTPNGGGFAAGPCTEPPPNTAPPDFPNPGNPGTDGTPKNDVPPPGSCSGLMVAYFIAAKAFAMGSLDNRIWNDLSQVAAGVSGEFISVAAGFNNVGQTLTAIFGTSLGEVVVTRDVAVSGFLAFTVPGNPRIVRILFDNNEIGDPVQGNNIGKDGGDGSSLVSYTQFNPGTLTIEQAYNQCIAVGFSPSSAVVAVAIMMRESALQSYATNTTGNTPPSTDRGIAQFNNYYHPEVSDACAFDTACAIREMFRVSSGGSDFSAWAAYDNSSFLTNLSKVQAQLGVVGDLSSYGSKNTNSIPHSLKAWLETDDGRIYVSYDSGNTWKIWADLNDGLTINKTLTPRIPSLDPALWLFGGDTGILDSLFRIASNNGGSFVPVQFSKEMLQAINLAGPGFSIKDAVLGYSGLLVAFDGGVEPRMWFTNDLNNPEAWQLTNGFSGEINALATGFESNFLVAGTTGTFLSTVVNGFIDFTQYSLVEINALFWQGLEGKYLGVTDDGLVTTIDGGLTWGVLRPNTTFVTTWPVGAEGADVAWAVGPRECDVIVWPCGSLIIGGFDDLYYVYDEEGNLLATLDNGTGALSFGGGAAFSPLTGNLYTLAPSSNLLVVFDKDSPFDILFTQDVSFGGGVPRDIIFDEDGNFYIAYSSTGAGLVAKYDTNGVFVESFALLSAGPVDSDSIDIGSQGLIFVSGQGEQIITNSDSEPPYQEWSTISGKFFNGIRLLPENGVLVASTEDILKLNGDGEVVITYSRADISLLWKDVAVSPDGTSFWAITLDSPGKFAKFSLSSGLLLAGPFTAPTDIRSILIKCEMSGNGGGNGGFSNSFIPSPPGGSSWTLPEGFSISSLPYAFAQGEAYVLIGADITVNADATATLINSYVLTTVNDRNPSYSGVVPDDIDQNIEIWLVVGTGALPEITGGYGNGMRIPAGIDTASPVIATDSGIAFGSSDWALIDGIYYTSEFTEDASADAGLPNPTDMVVIVSTGLTVSARESFNSLQASSPDSPHSPIGYVPQGFYWAVGSGSPISDRTVKSISSRLLDFGQSGSWASFGSIAITSIRLKKV